MRVENLGMLLQECNRSKAYIQKLINANLLPNFVLLLRRPGGGVDNLNKVPNGMNISYFNPYVPETESLDQANISYQLIQASSCNEKQVVSALESRSERYFVFSGSGVLKEDLILGKEIIHVHPGRLPEYRGSTCPYYCALAEGKWYATAFIMRPEIDQGRIITFREFELPRREIDATRIYDPYTRSEVLVDVVKQLSEIGTLKTYSQDLSKGQNYYIIHPILEFIAKESFSK